MAQIPTYQEEKDLASEFLTTFIDDSGDEKYKTKMQSIADGETRSIVIDIDDLLKDMIDNDRVKLFGRIISNTLRYIKIFGDAIDENMPESELAVNLLDFENVMEESSPERVPLEMKRVFEVYFKPSSEEQPSPIRDVKASNLGGLVKIAGVVTRCSNVEPLMQVAVYTCKYCNCETYQEVTNTTFLPLFDCPTPICVANRRKGSLQPQIRASKLVGFQKAKIQELAGHVPKGHIPRAMTVHLRGELTRKVDRGDIVELSGIFLPKAYSGFREIHSGLLADTYIEAMSVTKIKEKYEEAEFSEDVIKKIHDLAKEDGIYDKLAKSLGAEIFGHQDLKKALLLLLVGAPCLTLKDGMKIRGDIHICLIGDPGVAKSQLLKQIINLVPKGVYATGKGSSAVGLTASILKDPESNEMVLESGALVLSDMGICAIDEFDEMNESDQTSIYEAMEQQTVSIAKAGFLNSLNARASVLAAANPKGGRYDLKKTFAENINLSSALISRFDLIWLMIDRADMGADLEMAKHTVSVHQHANTDEPPFLEFTLEPSLLRAYVSEAKRFSPTVPKELTEYISNAYSNLRQDDATYTTARTLLSILRLSKARARVRFSESVDKSDVDEALRLMHMSKFSLCSNDPQSSDPDPAFKIFSILKAGERKEVTYEDALALVTSKGYTDEQLKRCLKECADMNILQIDPETFDVIQFI